MYDKITIFIAFLCLSLNANAADDIFFYHLGAKDGLSQISIMSIYQDEFGAMWFGSTEGLNRYNGREIEVFRPTQDGTALSRNIIYEICGNKAGAIYLRDELDLVRYDIYTQRFENIRKENVHAIAYDGKTLWAVVDTLIMRYDEPSGQLKKYVSLDKNIAPVIALYAAKDGTVWIGATRGLFAVSAKNPRKQQLVIDHINVSNIYQDGQGNIWIGTHQDGAYRIDTAGHIVNYRHQYGVNSISNNQVRNFVEDNSGNLWVATFYGLNMFNPQTQQWKHYTNNDNILHSLSHSSVFSLYKDRQGTIWAGTYFGGVNYFNPDADIFRFYEPKSALPAYLSFPYVGKMTEDKHGNLWVCTEGGVLNCLNLATRQFSRYVLNNKSKETEVAGYNQKSIWYREDKDLLYIGIHNGGLAIFNVLTKSSRILTMNDSPYALPNNTINEMQFYDGSLYLMTQSGIVRMDIDTEQFFPLDKDPVIGKNIASGGVGVGAFHIDSKHRLWVIKDPGVRAIHLKTGEVKEYEHDEANERSIGCFIVTNIFESSRGELFFATKGSGIFRYNPESDDFDRYSERKNGLLSDYCYYISEAPSGKLLLLHNKGFAFFNPNNPDEDLFRSSSGFPIAGFNIGNTAYVTRDKEIFVGGINGLVSFMESDIGKMRKDYTFYFDKLFINDKQVYPDDASGALQKTLPLCSQIELKYNQNNITVEFATSNYLQTMTHTYEYKLDGFDRNWLLTSTKRISYTNLNTGRYTLLVREASVLGVENGKIYSLSIRIKPPFLLTGAAFIIYGVLILLAVIGIFRFYLWRTRMETTLEFERKDKERIEELNRTKLRFFTNVSHEFRTPLTLIIGQVETLLMQSDLSAKVHNKLAKIHKNTNHLLTLISELLDFRKQEQGFYKLNIKHVELISYIKEIYGSFRDYAVNKQIKYKLDHPCEEIHVYIDPAHFRKAIYNLLSNAFKYTAPEGEITVKIRQQELEAQIQIIDNGIGIPPESLNKIFERFYQLEYRSSGLTSGTGIGLALTKEIVLSHKGKISVESTVNEGSIFTIILKLGTSHFSEEELNYKEDATCVSADIKEVDIPELDSEEPFPFEENTDADTGKPVVLVVDDNKSLLEMLTDSLAAHYNVYTAVNGKEGLDMAYKLQPDLLISDIMMPEMSGKELCYRLKNNIITSHIPIILLTAQTSDDRIIDGYMFGADAYITKPFNVKVLISQCNNLVKNRQLLYKKFAGNEGNVIPFNTVSEQDQVLIDKTLKIIRNNFGNPEFDINKLGVELGMGRSKLYTKIKEITGFTPNELTLNLKLQEAAALLDSKPHLNISEIAFELGFSSTKYFTKCFKTFYGKVPQEWRKRNTIDYSPKSYR
ncbi:MAG: response regulator [Dysgonamonadaceae bacterium]|jgi:signal transduction histidine kinase/ligand-binding sensor domain-containing protein/DNA-binding response OmpR family regulator|nr:response regulator [Dysgonamonadaceae bacterium]